MNYSNRTFFKVDLLLHGIDVLENIIMMTIRIEMWRDFLGKFGIEK